jgi:hypothetical protein
VPGTIYLTTQYHIPHFFNSCHQPQQLTTTWHVHCAAHPVTTPHSWCRGPRNWMNAEHTVL